jgi:hypothetical protein
MQCDGVASILGGKVVGRLLGWGVFQGFLTNSTFRFVFVGMLAE